MLQAHILHTEGGHEEGGRAYRVSQKKRSFRISKPLGPTDASGDNSVGKGCWRDVG